jgi:hypothetical protein
MAWTAAGGPHEQERTTSTNGYVSLAREEGADEALEEDVPLEWVREYQYTLAKREHQWRAGHLLPGHW